MTENNIAGSGRLKGSFSSSAWDHSTHDEFYQYYAEESISEDALQRFRRTRDVIIRAVGKRSRGRCLDIADLGCGAGMQSLVWAELGHKVHGLDVNGPLVELGCQRAARAGYDIDFRVGSATQLPWTNESMDVCVALELLEHVADWEACMKEFTRVLRPDGVLFMTTTNWLCPYQAEFTLPLYSWYPKMVKRHFERLAISTRPDIANFAKYPAVNWFTFYELRKWLGCRGFRSLDRFDLINTGEKGSAAKMIVAAIRTVPPLRWLGQICTPGTVILSHKS